MMVSILLYSFILLFPRLHFSKQLLTIIWYLVEKFPLDSKEIAKIAQQCNIKKDGAKNAQDASIQLYLAEYIHRQTQLHGPMYCEATVVAVLDSAYEIFIPEYGIEKRLHLDRMALTKSTYDLPNHTLILTWQADATEMNNTEAEKPVLNFDDDDTCDEEDLVKALESKLLMREVETTDSDNALSQDRSVDSSVSNNKKPSHSTAASSPLSDGIQIIKVFEKVKVRLEVDINKTPPMVNVHSVNPHFLV
jgi:protein SSD1